MKKGFDFTGVTIVFYCHDGEGNVVLGKRGSNCRDEHGTWDLGAGSLDFGDGIEQTLRKEIKEEYCTDVVEYQFLGYREHHRKHQGEKTHWISLNFKVLVDKEKVANGEPHKFDDVRFFAQNQFPEKVHSQIPDFIERLKTNCKCNQTPYLPQLI
ncbi:TPA: NUDIX hydrolase [Candidatus Woesearchaeota archaeon]|nr:RNA pyrophosphohydrolase [archaeon]HIJ11643.1 NUDIX hydrolase [Candidatus Woesearchaeota archaeon]|tara:strand:- start:853 stop:1317 length:465 start_codon:yes stop_codon:yes gene_type:complete